MKVIFLDIDGVLNYNGCRDVIGGIYFVNDDKIILLKEIIDRTDAKIVLSSTWRLGWFYRDAGNQDSVYIEDFNRLESKLGEYGITFLSRTPKLDSCYRGEEIDTWLQKWGGEPIESFIILDDDSDMKPHMDRLVKTSWQTGLCREHVEKAVSMLGEKNENTND